MGDFDHHHLTIVSPPGGSPFKFDNVLSPPINVSGYVEMAILSYQFSGPVSSPGGLHAVSIDIAGTSIQGSQFSQIVALMETLGSSAGFTQQYARAPAPLRWIPLSINGNITRITVRVQVLNGTAPNSPVVANEESVVELLLRRA